MKLTWEQLGRARALCAWGEAQRGCVDEGYCQCAEDAVDAEDLCPNIAAKLGIETTPRRRRAA